MHEEARRGSPSRMTSFWVLAACVCAVIAAALITTRMVDSVGIVRYMDVVLLGAAVASALVTKPARRRGLLAYFRSLWPVLALLGVDLLVRVISAANSVYQLSKLDLDTGVAYLWLLGASLPQIALFASLLVGLIAGLRWRGFGPWAYMATTIICMTTGFSQYLASRGIANPIADWVALLNTAPDAAARLWVPAATEPYRAVGFEFDPNFFGSTGLAVFVWAIAQPSRSRSRWWLALGGSAVIWLSASRTAAVAAMCAAVAVGVYHLVVAARRPHGHESRSGRVLPYAVGLAVLAPLLTGIVGSRLKATFDGLVLWLRGAPLGESIESLVTGGRFPRWELGWSAFIERPMGWFAPPDWVTGASLHNEYLDRLVWGGPLMLAVFLFALGWLIFRWRPSAAPAYPIAAGVGLAVTATMLPATSLAGLATLIFFGFGLVAGGRQRRGPDGGLSATGDSEDAEVGESTSTA